MSFEVGGGCNWLRIVSSCGLCINDVDPLGYVNTDLFKWRTLTCAITYKCIFLSFKEYWMRNLKITTWSLVFFIVVIVIIVNVVTIIIITSIFVLKIRI
jgi:hypothetical protein